MKKSIKVSLMRNLTFVRFAGLLPSSRGGGLQRLKLSEKSILLLISQHVSADTSAVILAIINKG